MDLSATPNGSISRGLWYARQAADLVHAVEVIALLGSDKAESLDVSYGRLAEKARDAGLREAASAFDKMSKSGGPRAGWLETLFSASWRLAGDVLRTLIELRFPTSARVQFIAPVSVKLVSM